MNIRRKISCNGKKTQRNTIEKTQRNTIVLKKENQPKNSQFTYLVQQYKRDNKTNKNMRQSKRKDEHHCSNQQCKERF